MPYATKAMIASEAKIGTEFSASTIPTADKVDEIIAEVEAYIDAKIGKKYAIPLDAAADLLIVRSISIALCTERVRGIMDSSAPQEEKESSALKDARSAGRTARRQLDEIIEGALPLSALKVSTSDGIRSYAVDNGCEPVFQRGKVQW